MAGSVYTDFNNSQHNVGVIIPPDRIKRCILFSDKEAVANIKTARQDIFINTKKPQFEDRFKTPKSVFYTLGAAAAAIAVPVLKKAFKK